MLKKDIEKISKLETPKELFAFLENEAKSFSAMELIRIFVLDEVKRKYILKRNIARKDSASSIKEASFSLTDPLIKHILDIKKPFLAREVDENIAVALTKERQGFLSLVKNKLERMEGEVCLPGFAKEKLLTVFILGKKLSEQDYANEEIASFSLVAQHCAKLINDFNAVKKEVELFVSSIRKINKALEDKDVYTKGHSDRVARISVIIGSQLSGELEKIPYGEISLYYAAEFHDIGKVALSASVLKKEDKLNAEEWKQMKRHPLESANIIKPLKKWLGDIVVEGVISHHENCDGTGYPYGKKEKDINILAKIIRVADSLDAMMTDRPYRKALAYHKAISELKAGSGTKFDPKVIEAFWEAHKQGLFKEVFLSQMESEG
ncbi:MAG: HD domain-containing protein [Candidatus Omnitrophota bacterium]|nr:MAG: HD domain-containing protein [Candidatus Omnitrophota bacterium]